MIDRARRPVPLRPSTGLALFVTVRWRGDVVALRTIRAGETASIGTHVGSVAAVPCGDLGCEGFDFASVRRDRDEVAAVIHVPERAVARVVTAAGEAAIVPGPTDVRLGAGDRAAIRIGDFEAEALATEIERARRGTLFARNATPAAWAYVAAVALLHGAAMAAAAHDRGGDAGDEIDVAAALRAYLVAAEGASIAPDATIEDETGEGLGRLVNDRDGDGAPGGGARTALAEGKAGSELSRARSRRWAVPERAPKDTNPALARNDALSDARAFGLLGLLSQGPSAPRSAFGDVEAHGADTVASRGSMWARDIGDAFGQSGLALEGIGEGGGGRGEGVGLGDRGALGHTDGAPGSKTGGRGSPGLGGFGLWGGGGWSEGGVAYGVGIGRIGTTGYPTRTLTEPDAARPKKPRRASADGDPRLPPDVIQRIVRQNFGRFRLCYERGLVKNPSLAGRVTTRFAIGSGGRVVVAADAGSSLPDADVVGCVVRAYYGLTFPGPPNDALVSAVYPIVFTPTD